jgi:hypothetical protein
VWCVSQSHSLVNMRLRKPVSRAMTYKNPQLSMPVLHSDSSCMPPDQIHQGTFRLQDQLCDSSCPVVSLSRL